jgi:CBS domain-containing membrane protein
MRSLFSPILAGARFPDRLLACVGALAGILVTSFVSAVTLGSTAPLPFLVAPMGASAVLVFAVPASPLAQPWPVVGGNVLSALVGVAAARLVPVPHLAAAFAVGGAILLMSLLRCLHPPGGAAALSAVIGGPAIASAGYGFAFMPVGVNALLLMVTGVLFHRFSGHSYPHRTAPIATAEPPLHPEDIDRALADLGETLDVAREDLELLFQRIEHYALARRRSDPVRAAGPRSRKIPPSG